MSLEREISMLRLPTFNCDDCLRKEELGSGSFGAVYTMQCIECDYGVVVKLLRDKIRERKRLFLKEPRILHNINKNSL